MPSKSGKMNRQEQEFARRYAVTNDGRYAAEKAGYGSPGPRAAQNLAKPAVQAEIRRQQLALLFEQVLPLAVQVHMEILADPKMPAGARVQAVKIAYDRTLGQQEGQEGKEPHEMTSEEIAKAIAQLEQIAFERAKPVENAQSAQAVRNDDVFS
jgi:phage terminase small subunit